MFWVEGVTALVIMAAFVIASFFQFRPEQVAHGPMLVRIGAGVQGAVIGLLIGFFILPLRLSFFAGEGAAPRPGLAASLSALPAFVLLMVIRRGALLRAPFVSKFMRAYRRAALLRTRDDALKNLAKLDEIEGRASPA